MNPWHHAMSMAKISPSESQLKADAGEARTQEIAAVVRSFLNILLYSRAISLPNQYILYF